MTSNNGTSLYHVGQEGAKFCMFMVVLCVYMECVFSQINPLFNCFREDGSFNQIESFLLNLLETEN